MGLLKNILCLRWLLQLCFIPEKWGHSQVMLHLMGNDIFPNASLKAFEQPLKECLYINYIIHLLHGHFSNIISKISKHNKIYLTVRLVKAKESWRVPVHPCIDGVNFLAQRLWIEVKVRVLSKVVEFTVEETQDLWTLIVHYGASFLVPKDRHWVFSCSNMQISSQKSRESKKQVQRRSNTPLSIACKSLSLDILSNNRAWQGQEINE